MTPEDLHALARHLRDQGAALRRLSVADRCRSLTNAIARLADPDDPLGRRARDVLPETVGLSPAMVDWALRTSIEPWLELRDGGITVLEGLLRQAPPHPDAIPVPPAFTVLILAGNVFTAALRPLLLGLAVGTPILVKLPRDQVPDSSLPVLLRDALSGQDTSIEGTHMRGLLHRALSITSFPGSDAVLETALFDDSKTAADLVVAYGSDETMTSLRTRLPATVRLLEHGHGASTAWVPAAALTLDSVEASARALALDIAAYDQRGCLSPVIAWVEDSAEVSCVDFAARLHQALRDLAVDIPPGPIDTATGAARAQWRGTAAVVGQVFASDDSAVVCIEDPSLLPASPLHRHIAVVPCPSVEHLGDHLRPWGVHLKCLGISSGTGGGPDEAGRVAVELTPPLAPRLCPLGLMQQPPAAWCAEGRRPLEGWLRWVSYNPTI